MTASENKTSSCEQRICFRSMMALHLVFSWDGAHMASYGIPYVGLTLVVLDLVIVAKYVFFDFHRCFLPDNHEFREQINAFRKGTVVTQGLPKRLTTAEIAEWHNRLVPKGDGFAGFGKEHN
jgi:hypothetical protein